MSNDVEIIEKDWTEGPTSFPWLKIIADRLEKIENFMIVILFIAMTIVCFLQVIFRYVFQYSAPWTEELGRYFMVYLIMIGAGWAVHADTHIRIDLLSVLIKNKKVSYILDLIIYVPIIAFCAFFAYAALVYIPQIIASNEVTIALGMPMWIPQSSIFIGAILMLVHYIELFLRKIDALVNLKRGEK